MAGQPVTETEFRQATATAFAEWMHVHGYTHNPGISHEQAALMAEAYIAGMTFGVCQGIDLYVDLERRGR